MPRTLALAALLFALVPAAAAAAAGDPGAGDPAAGEKAYVVCRACHQIGPDARNAVGPVHNGLVGRKAGTYPGYFYSAANRDSGLTWDEDTLAEYIRDPKAMIPGTKMLFSGIRDRKKVADIIAYIRQFDANGAKAGK